MSTIRRGSRPTDNLTLIANDFLRDTRVSLAARGLGAQLLSHRDGWEITTAGLAKAEGIGRDKLRGYMRELEDVGYLQRQRERLTGGRLGEMLYEIHDTPQLTENPSSDLRLDVQALVGQGLVSRPHKKTIFQKISKSKKINPSGGSSADASAPNLEPSPIHSEETPVVAPVAQDALFDVPAEKTARKRDDGPSARTVVAAYVESYRKHHAGADPSKAFVGRVARSAKAALESGVASPDELTAAAGAMGEGPYANLDVALSIHRQGGRRRVQASSPALPHTDPAWVAVAQQVDSDTYQRLLVDDELVQWMAGDQSEVDKWVSRHPELASRFATVA